MLDPPKDFKAALELLGRALIALQPYKDDLVLAGGMVPFLYRYHPNFAPTDVPAFLTKEADLVVRPRLAPGRTPIAELLESAALVPFEAPGYRGAPGAVYFQDRRHGTTKLATSYVEILAPLRGKPRAFLEPQKGLRAQALRYLDLLAHEPIEIDLQEIDDLEIETPCIARIPHPGMFIVQKLLARTSGRRATKQANDLAQIFDVVSLTRGRWSEVQPVLQRAALESEEWARWLQKAIKRLEELFGPDESGPIEVHRIYRSRMKDAAPGEAAISAAMIAFAAAIQTYSET